MSSIQSTSNIQRGKEEYNYPGSEISNRTEKLIDIILGVEMKIKQEIKNQLAAHDHEILDKFSGAQKSFDLVMELMEQSNSIIEDISGKLQSISLSVDKSISEQEALRQKIDDWESNVPTNLLANKNRPASGARELFFGGTQKMRNTGIRDTKLPQEPKSRFGHKFVRPVVPQYEAIVKTVDVVRTSGCIDKKNLWTGRCEGTFTSSDASSRSELDLNGGTNMNQESRELDMLSKDESIEEVSASLKDWWNEDENEDSIHINQFTSKETVVGKRSLPNCYVKIGVKSMSSVSEDIASLSSDSTPSVRFCASGQENEKVSTTPVVRYGGIAEVPSEESVHELLKIPNVKPVVGGFGNFRRGKPTPIQSSTIQPNLSGPRIGAGVIKNTAKKSYSVLNCEDSMLPAVIKPGSFFGKASCATIISTMGLSSPATEQRSNYSNEGAYYTPTFPSKFNSNDFGNRSGPPSRKPGPRAGSNIGKFNMKKAQQTGKKFTL